MPELWGYDRERTSIGWVLQQVPVQLGPRNLHSKQGAVHRYSMVAVFKPTNFVRGFPQKRQFLGMDAFKTAEI